MNVQRYADYRKKIRVGYPQSLVQTKAEIEWAEEGLVDLKNSITREKARQKAGGYSAKERLDKIEWRIKQRENRITSLKERLAETQAMSAEEWAMKSGEWVRAKKKYPELTDFIEKKFGGDFIT